MEQSSNSPETYLPNCNSLFQMQNATVIDVHKILSSIDVSKSTGHDGISNKLLKDSADIIAYSLTFIFNTSINTGIFPNDFKTAIISPIHKAGCKTECNNYRPISILSSVAKIFEKLITQQLETYLERMRYSYNNKLDLGKSTVLRLLSLTSQINSLLTWIREV